MDDQSRKLVDRGLRASKSSKPRGGLLIVLSAFLLLVLAASQRAGAATVDLVVNIVSDQPAYMSFDLEHFTVTISNNGPDPATNVALPVNHELADIPCEPSASAQPGTAN